ncbi:MAG: hypothetical protein AB1626_02500 [Candidatus Micrarchaeota archaeon]
MDEAVRERLLELSERLSSLQTKTTLLEGEVKELRGALILALNEVKKLKEKTPRKK